MTHVNKLEELKRKLGYECCFAVGKEGCSGGLGVFWKDSIHCSIISFSKHHIDLEVRDILKGVWHLTGFYGCPERSHKRESWDLVCTLHENSCLPWCILGDFNDIISAMDKKGLVDHPTWLINGFREVILDCGLHDVPLEGYPYTWQRRKGYNYEVEERLDKVIRATVG